MTNDMNGHYTGIYPKDECWQITWTWYDVDGNLQTTSESRRFANGTSAAAYASNGARMMNGRYPTQRWSVGGVIQVGNGDCM